jgi:hypothetical protein
MSTTTKPFELGASSFIEFEQIEPAAAAAEVAVPAGEAVDTDPLSITFGRKKDVKVTSTERMLAGPTIDWLIAFAADARPKALCDRFPHVANRLAEGWANVAESVRSLDALIADTRWGGAGFPIQVQIELQRVRDQRLS